MKIMELLYFGREHNLSYNFVQRTTNDLQEWNQKIWKVLKTNYDSVYPDTMISKGRRNFPSRRADVQIMVQPGSIAARNYPCWQKLLDKNHEFLS